MMIIYSCSVPERAPAGGCRPGPFIPARCAQLSPRLGDPQCDCNTHNIDNNNN